MSTEHMTHGDQSGFTCTSRSVSGHKAIASTEASSRLLEGHTSASSATSPASLYSLHRTTAKQVRPHVCGSLHANRPRQHRMPAQHLAWPMCRPSRQVARGEPDEKSQETLQNTRWPEANLMLLSKLRRKHMMSEIVTRGSDSAPTDLSMAHDC